MAADSRRTGMTNKILITIVLLLALAAILGSIMVGVQGTAVDAIFGSTNETEDRINDTKKGLLGQISDLFGGTSETADTSAAPATEEDTAVPA